MREIEKEGRKVHVLSYAWERKIKNKKCIPLTARHLCTTTTGFHQILFFLSCFVINDNLLDSEYSHLTVTKISFLHRIYKRSISCLKLVLIDLIMFTLIKTLVVRR